MKIAVVGAGNIGVTLGRKWAAADHPVIFGVRDPQAEKVGALLSDMGHGVAAKSISGAVDEAGAVLFAKPVAS